MDILLTRKHGKNHWRTKITETAGGYTAGFLFSLLFSSAIPVVKILHSSIKNKCGNPGERAGAFFPVKFFRACFAVLCLGAACSTAPKHSAEVYKLRDTAEAQLNLANKEADRGNYETAMVLLNDARRIAVSVDDPSLRIRTGLSRGNVLFSLGRGEEASGSWDAAYSEAEKTGSRELSALCRIHIARGRLLSAAAEDTAAARTVREEVGRDIGFVKSDVYYTAFGWNVAGLADKVLGRYGDAEESVKKALAIHEKGLYVEQAAYDWFLIASIRSVAGQYADAQKALDSAIDLDRRVENSWGLAADWRALGDVFKKSGNAAEAGSAYRRSAEIFRSLGMDDAAADAEARGQTGL
jgi:tetratricopeptide (TPR) repeat protein